MKARVFALLAVLALVLSACSAGAVPAMYIQPAGLTEEEEALARLLGADTEQHIFDVAVDSTAKSVHVKYYELIDGEWQSFRGGSMALDGNEPKGRAAFVFGTLSGDTREAFQFGKDFVAASHFVEMEEEPENTSQATAFLSNRMEIIYEKEIPIAVQISTSKNEVSSYGTEYFFQPEEYEKFGYEHVYALTVTFSQDPLS